MEISSETVKGLVDLGTAIGKQFQMPDGGTAVVVPAGYTVAKLPPVDVPEPALKRIAGTATLHDMDSFVGYVERYKTEATRIFAEPGFLNQGGRAHVVAVFDYHEKDAPHHGAHQAVYAPRYSDQWARWTKVSAFEQVPFAEWIEENRVDILDPPAASLIDLVRTFKATKRVDFDSVVYQPNGDVKLAYSEQSEAKGAGPSTAMPEKFKLGIPVYFRGERYEVDVWVRYRVGNGKVVFNLKVDRPDVIEDAAFNAIVGKIGEATGINVYLGRRA